MYLRWLTTVFNTVENIPGKGGNVGGAIISPNVRKGFKKQCIILSHCFLFSGKSFQFRMDLKFCSLLTISLTSPGFYVSTVQVF